MDGRDYPEVIFEQEENFFSIGVLACMSLMIYLCRGFPNVINSLA